MSYCSIILFENNIATKEIKYQNSWHGAAKIWDILYKRYLQKDPQDTYNSWMNNTEYLWALVKDPRISRIDCTILKSTFDYVLVQRKDFEDFSEDLLSFSYNIGFSHIPAWAYKIKNLDSQAIGFHHTSVSRNPWEIQINEDECRPYDLSIDQKHSFLYDF